MMTLSPKDKKIKKSVNTTIMNSTKNLNMSKDKKLGLHFFHQLLIIGGESKQSLKKTIQKEIVKTVLKDFDPNVVENSLSRTSKSPSWLGAIISEPYGREIFFNLVQKHPNNYLVTYALQSIKHLGFNSKNYHYEIDFSKVANHNNFALYVSNFLNKLITTQKKRDKILQIYLSGFDNNNLILPPKFERFCALVCFQPFLFKFALNSILSLIPKNPSLEPFLIHLCRIVISFAVTKCGFTIPQSFTFLFPRYISSLDQTAAKSLFGALQSESKLDKNCVKAVHSLLESIDTTPPCLFLSIPNVTRLFINSAFTTLSGDTQASTFLLRLAAFFSCSKDNYSNGKDKEFIVQTDINFDRIYQNLVEFWGLVSMKDFGLKIEQNALKLRRLNDHSATAVALLCVARKFLVNKDYYSTTFQPVATPIFFDCLYSLCLKFDRHRKEVFRLMTDIMALELPASFGAVSTITLHKLVVKIFVVLIVSGEFLGVLDFMGGFVSKLDHSLVRFFVVSLISAVSPPFSARFLVAFCGLLVLGTVVNSVCSDGGSSIAVNRFLGEILRYKRGLAIEKSLVKRLELFEEKTRV